MPKNIPTMKEVRFVFEPDGARCFVLFDAPEAEAGLHGWHEQLLPHTPQSHDETAQLGFAAMDWPLGAPAGGADLPL